MNGAKFDVMPRRSLPRAEWKIAHRVARVRSKLGSLVPHRGVNLLALLYAADRVVQWPTWESINAHVGNVEYVAHARRGVA